MNARFIVGSILFAFLTAAFSGCSQDGDVTIVNDCSTSFSGHIKEISINLEPGQSRSENIYVGKKAFFIGPDDIDVAFGGSTFTKQPFEETVAIKAGESTVLRITSDVGAIYFTNGYSLSVNDIAVKRCSEGDFGANLLEEGRELGFNKSIIIRVPDGCWDIFVQYGIMKRTDVISNDTLTVGEVDTILWEPAP